MRPEERLEARRTIHLGPAILRADVRLVLRHVRKRAHNAPRSNAGQEHADNGGSRTAIGERDDSSVGVCFPSADDNDAEEEDGRGLKILLYGDVMSASESKNQDTIQSFAHLQTSGLARYRIVLGEYIWLSRWRHWA